jgi:hypothetical protein
MLGELGLVTPNTAFPVPRVQAQFSADGDDLSPQRKNTGMVARLLDETSWYARVLARARDEEGPPF